MDPNNLPPRSFLRYFYPFGLIVKCWISPEAENKTRHPIVICIGDKTTIYQMTLKLPNAKKLLNKDIDIRGVFTVDDMESIIAS